MSLLSRRGVLRALLAIFASAVAALGYAVGYEPLRRPVVTRYRPRLADWPADLPLRIAVLSDIHASEPWMSAARIGDIVGQTNALKPDLILLLGDFVSGMRAKFADVPEEEWAKALAGLAAPLGVHAVLGNHDWWEDAEAQARKAGPVRARRALEKVGLPVYENDARRLEWKGRGFWLAGLADQIAILRPRGWGEGFDDLPGTLAQVSTDEPVILLAHEPDIFPEVPARVALTLSGHTHGGQVRLFGRALAVPSRFGTRYAYGEIVEDGRTLIVSGGLGVSVLPVRVGMPPEIVLIELG